MWLTIAGITLLAAIGFSSSLSRYHGFKRLTAEMNTGE
jgi:hypothetical protein